MDDNAEKLLFALYAEWCRKNPELRTAAGGTGLAGEALGRAVNYLYTGGFVGGVTVKFGDDDNNPVDFTTDDIILTRRGATHVENALGLQREASSIQKLRQIIAKAGAPGWEGVRAIATKGLQEHMENN